jgi:CarboxypepD_reg-like domain
MQEEQNKYSLEYIRKYFDGQLSDQEMQALEKAALEDPFLADAMEGFEESRKHAVSFESGIADLKTKLAQRISKRNRQTGILFQLSKWPVAASFLLIIGLAVFTVTYVSKKPKISQTIPHPDSATVTLSKPAQENSGKVDTIKPDQPVIASVKSREIEKNSARRKEKKTSEQTNKSIADEYAAGSLAADSSVFFSDTSHETEKSEVLARKEIAAPLAAAAKQGFNEQTVPGIAINPAGGPSGNYIRGVVINDKGKPVPYAKVSVQGSSKHVFTDSGGFFKLYMKNPKLAALVYLQPAGYQSASAELIPDSNITNTIQLHYSSTESDLATVPKDKISPSVIGWGAFYHFIDSNKKINTKDSLLKGEEVISFTLYSDGRLSPFRIEESISPAHDKEILRLIPLAPALKLREKKKIRCFLQIQFK